MKTQIISTLLISSCLASLSFAALKPTTDLSKAPTNDPFIGYQWAIMNQGQVVDLDLDDTHPVRLTSNPKANIGWKNFDDQMKREVVVAILDSGVDVDHPELQGRLLKGYNFTARNPNLAKIYDDKVGHGTHMAGIIAAISNNGEGISGLSNKIKILPLKVHEGSREVSDDAIASAPGGHRETITDRVMKAVNFAIDQRVDVIHLSLGWPRVHNTPEIEAVFKKASDAGIIIVAAAGNDHHDGQIYPCAYKEVICVAGVGIDGLLTNSSNFGGHVDIAAPGQEILSLFPHLMTSTNFGPRGYEIKTGTSQAAPFVSGAAAILKGIYPDETPEQIRARLLLSAIPFDKKVSFGLLNIENAVAMKNLELTAPVFKRVEDATVNPQNLEFSFSLTIEKGGTQVPIVQVHSLSSDVQITNMAKVSEDDKSLQYQVTAKMDSLNAGNRFSYSVDVNGRNFEAVLLLKTQLQDLSPKSYAIGHEDIILANGLSSVANPRNNSDVRYWTYEAKDNSALTLYVWTLEQGQMIEKSVILNGLAAPQVSFNMISEDFDMDGQTDFLFLGVGKNEKNEVVKVEFVYLDSNLKVKHRFELKYDGTLPVYKNIKDIALAKITVLGLGAIKVPVYWDEAMITKADLDPDVFEFELNRKTQHLYYFQPQFEAGKWQMISRTLTASALEKAIRNRLQLSLTQDIENLALKVQSRADEKAGHFEFIFSEGRGINVRLHSMTFEDLAQSLNTVKLANLDKQSIDLSKNFAAEAINFKNGTVDSETDFQAIFSFISARSVLLRNNQLGGHRLDLPRRGESIVGITKSFTKDSDLTSFFETSDYLRAQGTWGAKKIDTKTMIYRSTFLPGSLFSQIFVPVIVSKDQKPGILVDNSRIFSNSVLVYTLEGNGELSAKVNRSIDLPANCSLRRVPMLNSQNYSRLAFLCKEQQGFNLRLIDLN